VPACSVALTQMPPVVPLHCFGSKPLCLMLRRMYVVGKDMSTNTVHVAEGGEHPALYAETALLAAPHWVAGAPPLQLNQVRATRADAPLLCFTAHVAFLMHSLHFTAAKPREPCSALKTTLIPHAPRQL
jgi:tRNA methyl transferase